MGHPKRAGRATVAPVTRNTRNRTRLNKTKLITDPAQSTLELTNQLRDLGLYAAPTLGDGNCLFRALADQLWGSPKDHLQLRREICDWMETHKERYEGFVDEDRTFDTHIRCMRIPGTYGGHLELSAFAHLKRRNVKVIQPGLVYVIEWNCGWTSDVIDTNPQPPVVVEAVIDDSNCNERDRRYLRRDKMKLETPTDEAETAEESGAVYVAYHDWEHFSSVRNLIGPHTGLPIVVERPESETNTPPCPVSSKSKGKAPATPRRKGKSLGKAAITTLPVAASTATATTTSTVEVMVGPPLSTTSSTSATHDGVFTPSQIPLPPSRSVSPYPSLSQASLATAATTVTIASTSTSAECSSLSSLSPPPPPDSITTATITATTCTGLRVKRSPKRNFDDHHDAEGTHPPSSPVAKRRKPRTNTTDHTNNNVHYSHMDHTGIGIDEADENTPSLSDDSSRSRPASSNTSTTLSSPTFSLSPSPVHNVPDPKPEHTREEVESESEPPPQKPLTRRQRKALGLPHPRAVALKASATAKKTSNSNNGHNTRASAGKIIIPGGRRVLRSSAAAGGVTMEGEWRTNGTGRLDVRGFRELKI